MQSTQRQTIQMHDYQNEKICGGQVKYYLVLFQISYVRKASAFVRNGLTLGNKIKKIRQKSVLQGLILRLIDKALSETCFREAQQITINVTEKKRMTHVLSIKKPPNILFKDISLLSAVPCMFLQSQNTCWASFLPYAILCFLQHSQIMLHEWMYVIGGLYKLNLPFLGMNKVFCVCICKNIKNKTNFTVLKFEKTEQLRFS